jgi:hypothetical protein
MTHPRRIAMIAGGLYLVTFVTSIPALALKTPFLDTGQGVVAAQVAVLLEVLLAVACVGTAVTLYPLTRRVDESLALGFVASRTVEAALILIGVLAVMSLVTLNVDGVPASAALSALHTWAFLFGPAVMSAINALLLGTLLLRSGLVPRAIPLLGLVGAPLLLASSVGVVLGLWGQTSPVGAAAALPIAAWELALGLRLVVAGFRPEALAALAARPREQLAGVPVPASSEGLA